MKLVLVEWIDSHAGRGWLSMESIERAAQPLRCRSVGWLLAKTKTATVIVPHISGESDGVVPFGCGDLTIPNKAIVKLRILRAN